ncbi:MAG: hypothetical protein GZ094_19645 [Mariniphaga sp.]|nr:hypothetical protein [Mariniphaga sp.]
MEKVERILVNDQQIRVSSVLDEAKAAVQAINSRLIPAMETIGISPSQLSIKDCIVAVATATKKGYFADVALDLKATRTPGIRKQQQEAAEIEWYVFEDVLSLVRREVKHLEYLTITEGKAELTAANAEKLADAHRSYITDPKEMAVYNLHVEIVNKLNQLFKGNIPFQWWGHFPHGANGQIVRNDNTNYEYLNTL